MNARKVSVIATTYNQSVDLQLYLKSLTRQSFQDFELVIADDGSREDTQRVLERFKRDFFGERLVHVWHEDLGYRKCKILNEAIRRSSGDLLIFTDSDLILHPMFISDHLAMHEGQPVPAGKMFMGRRVDLGREVSEWVRGHAEALFTSEFYFQVLKSVVSGGSPGTPDAEKTAGVKRALRIESPRVARVMGCFKVPSLLGSNFSVDREVLIRVNGFDESREHYWGEDGDLFIRIRNSGARIVGRKSFAVQMHLWHPLRKPQPEAHAEYERMLGDQTYVRCPIGLAR